MVRLLAFAAVASLSGIFLSGGAFAASGKQSSDQPAGRSTSESIEPASEPQRLEDISESHVFDASFVSGLAYRMSLRAYQPPAAVKNKKLSATYDAYRKIQFDPKRAIWRREPPGFEVHALKAGWLYKKPVRIYTVANGTATRRRFHLVDFLFSGNKGKQAAEVALSGFRINGPLNSRSKSDEIVVFQGASYFRGLARNLLYGLSARGLAIGTGSPDGEEFPDFRALWIEEPAAGSTAIVVHALMDSPSTTGAYRFVIEHGETTTMDVQARLFPRRDIDTVGLAPLTSMFLTGPTSPSRVMEFRPEVHDSGALAILTEDGERIWRPLVNPRSVQFSAFMLNSPRGFGLVQRQRDYREYLDMEAKYHKRPTAWIDFKQDMGKGRLVLVELPTEDEFHDNIVAFWRPEKPLQGGAAYTFNYNIKWNSIVPTRRMGPSVVDTRVGRAYADGGERAFRFVIEYRDTRPFPQKGTLPVATIHTSSGRVDDALVQRNPHTGGLRVTFIFYCDGTDLADLRATLEPWNERKPETWVYRWSDASACRKNS